ncbi:hypothetical protein RvY_09707 [Ramazzottius varieornatus]|uniref:PH domain-containing protein n=1 Tax=Ramazzottius varieornatus TaxID=947166 RepID=A0A1D1VAB8_RAMVA|nr:hypothetical protein RvY_09707 [Ramazzottius varieornatus]
MASTLIEGYLYKNKKFKPSGWTKKWYIVQHHPALDGRHTLDYYADESKKKLSGQIQLSQSDEVEPIQNCIDIRGTYRYAFKLKTPKQEYFFAATSQLDMTKWVSCLSQVCGIKSDTSDDEAADARSFALSQSTAQSARTVTSPQELATSPSVSSQPRTTLSKERSLSNATPVLQSPKNSALAQKRNMNDENPYVHLRNCISKASKPLDRTTDTLKKRNVEKELSIPDDFAPPPPTQHAMNDEGFYKSPPQCVVYDSKDATELAKRWSGESDSTVPTGTYDTPPSRTPSVWAPTRKDFEDARSSQVETPQIGQTYDVVPSSSRSASRQTSIINTFPRKLSVMNESESQQYDQIPKPKATTMMKPSGRLVPSVSVSEVSESVYDRPPVKGISSSGSLSAPRISPRPSLSSTSGLVAVSKENVKSEATPPTVDRNSKPMISSEDFTGHSATVPRAGHLRRIGSPPNSPGLYSSPSNPTKLTRPDRSVSHILQSSTSLRSPGLKSTKSTSEEDLTLKDDSNDSVDFGFRRHTGTRTLPRQRRPPAYGTSNSIDVEYTDVAVSSTGSGQKASLKPVDLRYDSARTAVKPVPQLSPRSLENPAIDYRRIDPHRTQALQKTIEYRSIGNH